MQPTAFKEAVMRLRSRRSHRRVLDRRVLALDPRKVTISQSEILDDLLYPARAPRSAARARR